MPDTNHPQENINRIDVDDSQIDENDTELVEIELSEDLQKVLFYALDEAVGKLENEEEFKPFTLTLAGDDVFLDEHDNEDVEECVRLAGEAVNMIAHIADAYVFCYDGYIELEDGTESDMLVAEVGEKGEDGAIAFGLMYRYAEDGSIDTDESLIDLGGVENLFDPEAVATAEAMQSIYAEIAAEEKEEEGDGEDEGAASGEEN